MELTIQQLAERAGVQRDTVRYYEKLDLLPKPARNEANYRIYGESSLERVRFIKSAQALGFTLKDVNQMLGHPKPTDIVALLTERLNKTKKEIVQFTSKKDKLESILEKCTKDEDQNVSFFFDYLKQQRILPGTELMFCRHSYLYDIGQWQVKGVFRNDGESPVQLRGHVFIEHQDNLWHIRRDFLFLNEENKTETIEFCVPSFPHADITQEFTADCSMFGDVLGTIEFADHSIFKTYRMPAYGISGREFLKRVHTNLYEAHGMLSNGQKTICSWNYDMCRELQNEKENEVQN